MYNVNMKWLGTKWVYLLSFQIITNIPPMTNVPHLPNVRHKSLYAFYYHLFLCGNIFSSEILTSICFVFFVTGSPVWISSSKCSTATYECEKKKNTKITSQSALKMFNWLVLSLYSLFAHKVFLFCFFRFHHLMPILSHPRIPCNLCSRTSPHRWAR